MKALTFLAATAVFTGALATEAMADGRNPGSVLIYPVHRSGGNLNAWFTILCVTNTNTMPQTPVTLGGGTNVHFEYVNITPGTTPFLPAACTIFDRIEYLTPADTLCVLTSCHNAFGGMGQEGYVVVTAEDPAQSPGWAWDHDFLIGSEMLLSASGVAYMINAIPFNAIAANPALPGGPLQFDGVNYEGISDVLMTDFVAATNSQLALINMTGGPMVENQVYLSVWNDNERALSATFRFRCWIDLPLATISPLFSNAFLSALPNDPTELDITCNGIGDLETGWMTIDSQGVFYSNGQPFAPGLGDGALLGSITAGPASVQGGHLLWEHPRKQLNGAFRTP